MRNFSQQLFMLSIHRHSLALHIFSLNICIHCTQNFNLTQFTSNLIDILLLVFQLPVNALTCLIRWYTAITWQTSDIEERESFWFLVILSIFYKSGQPSTQHKELHSCSVTSDSFVGALYGWCTVNYSL